MYLHLLLFLSDVPHSEATDVLIIFSVLDRRARVDESLQTHPCIHTCVH